MGWAGGGGAGITPGSAPSCTAFSLCKRIIFSNRDHSLPNEGSAVGVAGVVGAAAPSGVAGAVGAGGLPTSDRITGVVDGATAGGVREVGAEGVEKEGGIAAAGWATAPVAVIGGVGTAEAGVAAVGTGVRITGATGATTSAGVGVAAGVIAAATDGTAVETGKVVAVGTAGAGLRLRMTAGESGTAEPGAGNGRVTANGGWVVGTGLTAGGVVAAAGTPPDVSATRITGGGVAVTEDGADTGVVAIDAGETVEAEGERDAAADEPVARLMAGTAGMARAEATGVAVTSPLT